MTSDLKSLNRTEAILSAKEIISTHRAIVVLTGAGISAESGVPTFRGKDGYWKNYKAEELATPAAFESDPQLVWEWYDIRRRKLLNVKPNPAHYAIAELEKKSDDFTLITQNVDGLHLIAGSKTALEIHGNIWRVRCTYCGIKEENTQTHFEGLPRCTSCGGLLRPDIVWFGEALPEEVLTEVYNSLNRCDVLIIVGTSGIVQPAASFAYTAKNNGSKVIEVNIEETYLSDISDVKVLGKAGEVLPKIVGGMD